MSHSAVDFLYREQLKDEKIRVFRNNFLFNPKSNKKRHSIHVFAI